MAVGCAAHAEWVCINSDYIALELRIFASLAVHSHLGVKDQAVIASLIIFCGLAKRAEHERCIRCVEILAQRLDQVHEVLLVTAGVRRVITILVALPPDKTGNLIFGGSGLVLADIGEDFFRVRGVVVVLLVTGVNPGRFLLGLFLHGNELIDLAPRR